MLDATARDSIRITETAGDLRIDLVDSDQGDVSLVTLGGLDRRRPTGAAWPPTRRSIWPARSTSTPTAAASAISERRRPRDRLVATPATGDVGLEAATDIYLTETAGTLRLVLAEALGGDIRITVRETVDDARRPRRRHVHGLDVTGRAAASRRRLRRRHDPGTSVTPVRRRLPIASVTARVTLSPRVSGRTIDRTGAILTAARSTRISTSCTTVPCASSRTCCAPSRAAAIAASGFVRLRSATTSSDAEQRDRAGTTIDISATGRTATPASGPPSSCAATSCRARPVRHPRLGQHRRRHFQFGDPTASTATTTVDTSRLHPPRRETRVYGSNDLSAADDGEDRFLVYYLQTMTVAAGPHADARRPGRDATTTRSTRPAARATARNYVDQRPRHRRARTTASTTRDRPRHRRRANDIFLLRRRHLPIARRSLSPASTTAPGVRARCCTATLRRRRTRRQTAIAAVAPSGTQHVQRINYDTALNGRLTVYGLRRQRRFSSTTTPRSPRSTAAPATTRSRSARSSARKRDRPHGGARRRRTSSRRSSRPRAAGCSRAHARRSSPHGGTGNDEFIVYSNQAELRLEGDDDNDLFIVRAFALAATRTRTARSTGSTSSSRSRSRVIGGFSTAAGDSTSAPAAATTRSSTTSTRPVSVDGGTGFDKLVVLGTEFADDIVITDKAIFGAGLNVRYANVEVVEVDGLEGDDEFFVLSTAFGVAYRVIGGLGSDTINVTGDVTEDIVSRELEGASGAVDHLVTLHRRLRLRRPRSSTASTSTSRRGDAGRRRRSRRRGGHTTSREGGPVTHRQLHRPPRPAPTGAGLRDRLRRALAAAGGRRRSCRRATRSGSARAPARPTATSSTRVPASHRRSTADRARSRSARSC